MRVITTPFFEPPLWIASPEYELVLYLYKDWLRFVSTTSFDEEGEPEVDVGVKHLCPTPSITRVVGDNPRRSL